MTAHHIIGTSGAHFLRDCSAVYWTITRFLFFQSRHSFPLYVTLMRNWWMKAKELISSTKEWPDYSKQNTAAQRRPSWDAECIKHEVEWLAQITTLLAFQTTLTDAYPSALPFVRDLFLHLKQTLSLSHTHTHAHAKTHTLTAYTTLVTSHTLVISKDTKPTRSPTQFPRMQRKWSCKQALSLTGKKGTEKKYQCWRKEGDGWREIGRAGGEGGKKQEVDFYLTHSLSSLLYNILRQGFAGKVRTLWMVHTNAPPPYPDRKRHNEPSVLSARGGHAQKTYCSPCQI